MLEQVHYDDVVFKGAVGPVCHKMKKNVLIHAIVAIIMLAAPFHVAARQADPAEKEKPVAEKKPKPPEQEIPALLKKHRAPFSADNTDAGALAISATELIKFGDQEWLCSKLVDGQLSEAGVLAVVTAFEVNDDISALTQVLILSVADSREQVRERCEKALAAFLEKPKTRVPTIKKVLATCSGEGVSNELLLASISALGYARDLAAVDILIAFVKHTDAGVRARANKSLVSLTYQGFGEDAGAWKSWWDGNKHLSRDHIIEPVLKARIAGLEKKMQELEAQQSALALQMIESVPQRAVDFLSWDDAGVRRRAAEVITENRSEELVKGIMEQLISHLQNGENDEKTLLLLLDLVGSGTSEEKRAQEILLLYMRDDPRDVIKVRAAKSLQQHKTPEVCKAVGDLLGELKDERGRAELKLCLLDLLTMFDHVNDCALITPFLGLKNDKGIRGKAVKALGACTSEKAVDLLLKAFIEDPESEVRFEVTGSLARIGKAGTPENGLKAKAVEALKRGLVDKESFVRETVIRELGTLAPPDGVAIIQEHLRVEKDAKVRLWCVKALGMIHQADGLAVISKALSTAREGEAADKEFVEEARRACSDICGDDINLWQQAVEIFSNDGHYVLAGSCSDSFLSRAQEKNGHNGAIERVKILKADSWYKIYMGSGEIKKAVEQARLLTEIAPEDNGYLLEYARVLVKAEDFQAGAATYGKLIARYPADKPAELWLIKIEAAECSLALKDNAAVLALLNGFPVEGPGAGAMPEELVKRFKALKEKAAPVVEEVKEPPKEPVPAPPEPGGDKEGGTEVKPQPEVQPDEDPDDGKGVPSDDSGKGGVG